MLKTTNPPNYDTTSEGEEAVLRYVHKDGLLMRHDKKAFAEEAIEAAAVGKIVGDYVRILIFSYYAQSLPWDIEKIKNIIDPFTGSFVSLLPLNLVYLRLALKAADLFTSKSNEDLLKGNKLLSTGARRLNETIHEIVNSGYGELKERFEREKRGWILFYDILDRIEDAVKNGDPFACELQDRAKAFINNAKINFSSRI